MHYQLGIHAYPHQKKLLPSTKKRAFGFILISGSVVSCSSGFHIVEFRKALIKILTNWLVGSTSM